MLVCVCILCAGRALAEITLALSLGVRPCVAFLCATPIGICASFEGFSTVNWLNALMYIGDFPFIFINEILPHYWQAFVGTI